MFCSTPFNQNPHHPQSNSIAEHFNRTILDISRCDLAHSDLRNHFCDFAVLDATYKFNHTSPDQSTRHPSQSVILALRSTVFPPSGSHRTAINRKATQTKLQSRSGQARFLHNISHDQFTTIYTDTSNFSSIYPSIYLVTTHPSTIPELVARPSKHLRQISYHPPSLTHPILPLP